jgi:hypothetical protein
MIVWRWESRQAQITFTLNSMAYGNAVMHKVTAADSNTYNIECMVAQLHFCDFVTRSLVVH